MKTVLVPLAPGCEEIEAVTIIDILRRAGIAVVSAGLGAHAVKASRGVMLEPDTTLDEALTHEYDMVALPGGQPGTDNLMGDARILHLVKHMAEQGRLVAAVCAAPAVLAKAGLLDGRRATAYPGTLDEFPKVKLLRDAVVEDGNIITARGPGVAIDFALTLVEHLAGHAKRVEVETGLQR
jgi:4-methyl-5(b-hydroxyethyl)-thiazole monophosphate biosynthesis